MVRSPKSLRPYPARVAVLALLLAAVLGSVACGVSAGTGARGASPAATPTTPASPAQAASPAPAAPVAEAVPPHHGSRTIAFAKGSVGGPEGNTIRGYGIHVVRTDGSGLRRVTASGTHPAWSPDGERLAYCEWMDGIWVVGADGSGDHAVTHTRFSSGVDWSPDGTQLVFAGSDPPGRSRLYVVNVDGTGRRPLVDGGPGTEDRFPVWAADGRIYFLRGYDSYRNAIVAVDPDGGDQEVVTAVRVTVGFSVSPDGMWLVFCDAGDLVCVAASGLGAQIVVVSKAEVDNGRLSAGVYGPSSWSSDGRMIGFGFGSGPWAWPGPIHVVRSDGWSVREVPRVIGWDPAVRPE